MSPSFCIVVPTLVRGPSIVVCLKALLDQADLGETNILAVDNGDGWLATTLREMPGPISKVRVVREARKGVGRARNAGLRAATTDWVIFTDDDCVVPEGWFRDIRDHLIRHPDLDISGGLVDEPERPGAVYSFMRRLNYMNCVSRYKKRHDSIPSLGAANLACRRARVLAIGGFDEDLVSTEDYELLVRANGAGLKIGLYAQVPAVIHHHDTDLARFMRRYRSYGRGVGQTVVKHRLDWVGHRVYVRRGSPLTVLVGAIRFAIEDLATLEGSRQILDFPLALLRGLAFQAGAWRALERR